MRKLRKVKKIPNEKKEKMDNRNNADKNEYTIQADVKFFKLRIKQSLSTNMILFTEQLVQKIIVQKIISEKTGAQFP